MYQIDQEIFGKTVRERRIAKGMTQKDLAEKLFVSDKAVSKWERGASLPNVTLLIPLAEVLGLSVVQLLGTEAGNNGDIKEDEKKIQQQIKTVFKKEKRIWRLTFVAAALISFLEMAVLFATLKDIYSMGKVIMTCGLMLLFGVWLFFFAKDTLPSYYDENRISYVVQGPFKLHMSGLAINNNNWLYIRRALMVFIDTMLTIYPLISIALIISGNKTAWDSAGLYIMLSAMLCLIVSIYIVGKKHE